MQRFQQAIGLQRSVCTIVPRNGTPEQMGIGSRQVLTLPLSLSVIWQSKRTIAVARSDEEGFESSGRSGADPA